MEKTLWNALFSRFKGGSFKVRYWDGEEASFGDGAPEFCCRFNGQPHLADLAADPYVTLGEAYMDGLMDLDGDLDAVFRLVHLNPAQAGLGAHLASAVGHGLHGLGSLARQKENIKAHYDLGNDFFSLWLDETMIYSCAYFKEEGDSLERAQLNKIDLTLKKLRLKPGQRLLDIGCGWGWLILRAAKEYGARALGITLSEGQYAEAQKRIAEAGLAGQVECRLVNYLELGEKDGSFDRVVSVGMFEHVGRDHFRDYFKKVTGLLKPGGLTLLHTLTNLSEKETNAWVKKYIFPGGYIPSLREVMDLLPDYDLRTLHVESLRRHYAKTLDIWHRNFSRPGTRAKVVAMFDERFARMWELYLAGAAASLRTGSLDVHQLLLSKGANNALPMTLAGIYE